MSSTGPYGGENPHEAMSGVHKGGGGGASEPELTFPPRLERYLAPDLWQKLTTGIPRRGVLLNALDRLRSVLYLVSTYLPQHLVQEKMRRPAAGLVRGRLLRGSLLFADVSGFTALSERLASLGQEGAEQLTDLMNRYFERMLQILSWSGGILLKFAGDALLVFFPEQEGGEQARWATRASQRMLRAMADFAAIETPLETVSLQMKIGVGTGEFLGASVGAAERMEYVVLGETVARTLAAEGAAAPGQVITDEATTACLDAACRGEAVAPGLHAVSGSPDGDLGDFEIKAERRRARGAIPWSARLHAIAAQMEIVLRQIEALTPYLAPELVERIVARARQRRVGSEFRPTVVLFVNFTGLEPLLAAWGAEGLGRTTGVLNDYFKAMHQVIARHGGVVSRIDPYSQGSKMLVLFGAPVAHEDDPQRAVSAALAMNEALARLNRRWLRKGLGGPLVRQRIGVTQGDTFAGQAGSVTRREYTVMGDDVNLAARLMSAAEPGQILLSQRVYDTVVDHFAAEALPPIRVKGKSQPVPIYQPTGLRDDPLARRMRQRGPLVGREAEMEQAWEVLRRAQSGQGAIMAVVGPAGVGKSHLADRLASLALARGFQVVLARCCSFHAETPYAPWVVALQTLLGIEPAGGAEARRETLLHSLADLELPVEEYAAPLGSLLGLGVVGAPSASPQAAKARAPTRQAAPAAKPALFARLEQKVAQAEPERQAKSLDLWQLVQERRQTRTRGTWQTLQARAAARRQEWLRQAVSGLLARLASEGPLLLLFENAQWLDPASRDLLGHLGERWTQLPVLALVVQRGEEREATADPETTLALGPLSSDGAAALAAGLLGQELGDDLAQAIYQRSGGNPLFIEEIARWVQRSGPAALDGLRGGEQTSLTLQELVLSRLDSLPHPQRDLARRASVVGVEFGRDEIHALLPASLDEASVDAQMAGLEAAQFIFSTGTHRHRRYAFRRTLDREVIYRSQSFAQRRDLHARLAAHLEASHPGEPDAQAELLAHHYELGGCAGPAARYLLLSAHNARQRYAYAQAGGCYRRALAALQTLPPAQTDAGAARLKALAHEGVGDVALLSGEFDAAAEAYGQARAGLAELPAGLLLKLALTLPSQGQAAEAVACARQAWASNEGADRAGAAATLAWLLWRGDDGEAGDWVARAQALVAGNANRWAAGVRALLDDLAGDWTSAQRAYLALDLPVGAALAACRQGDRHLQAGETDGALALYGQAAALWEQENDGCGLALARYRQAEALTRSADLASARAALEEALALLEAAPSACEQDLAAVRQALAGSETWQPWRWRRYDDAFRISILFRP